MARNTTAKKAEEPTVEMSLDKSAVVLENSNEIDQPLNLEQQVTVHNIARWPAVFQRLLTIGDVTVPKSGSIRLSRNEIISQIHNNNTLFNGTDGKGSHATLIVKDKATLEEVGFDPDKQFSEKAVKELFEERDNKLFEAKLKDFIVTRAEKYSLMNAIVKLGINDFTKIRICENYTGYKIDKIIDDSNR